ncbi:hypothetical protein Kisp02_25300 [Kineosporia sp. NBRC 101731]|nr:hypothetical protein Kisp02_25300 [Kineosporia sp. NBRC 101731]
MREKRLRRNQSREPHNRIDPFTFVHSVFHRFLPVHAQNPAENAAPDAYPHRHRRRTGVTRCGTGSCR